MGELITNKAFDKVSDKVNHALSSGAYAQLRRLLSDGLAASDVAHLIESSPPKERQLLWSLLNQENRGEVLQYLSDDVQSELLSTMDAKEIIATLGDLETDDLADILQQLPYKLIDQVLEVMDSKDRQRVEAVLSYAEKTAGGLMNTDMITIRPDLTLEVVWRYLRLFKELPEMTDNLLVINRKDKFVGILPTSKILINDPETTVQTLMETDVQVLTPDLPDTQVANLFKRYDLVSAPVVDANGELLGRITIDDVVDVISEESDRSLLGMAGLGEDTDAFAPIVKVVRNRALWLVINLATAIFASSVIGLFKDTIAQVVALAVLMPIVANMGGIAGTQALTIVIRAVALDQINKSNTRWLLQRELLVGFLQGFPIALITAACAYIWFGDSRMGIVIALAMVINLVVATISGGALPIILKKLSIDPALAGGVMLTTVTDTVGFLSFLGLASLFYA